MVKTIYSVVVADALMLIALFYVSLDLQWRASYAASPHDACGRICSYSASFSYSLLTRFFTMSGNGVTLTSPLTFDWVQSLVFAIVVLNVWFAYKLLESRKSRRLSVAQPK
jgi:hypothetical protein